MKTGLSHVQKDNLNQSKPARIRNIKVHKERYSMLLVASFSSLLNILGKTCSKSQLSGIRMCQILNDIVEKLMMMAHRF